MPSSSVYAVVHTRGEPEAFTQRLRTTVAETAQVAQTLTRSHFGAADATLLYQETEGNPLFIAEITRYLVDEGVLGKGQPAAQGRGGRFD